MSKETVGFIGLGNMGEPMVRVLLKAGYQVNIVPHRRKEPAERLAAEGANVVQSPEEAAKGAQFVITMVPNLPQIEEVTLGENGIVHGAEEGLVLINMSTVSPSGIRELGEKLAPYGISICDAPVSGGPVKAADGTLSIMAGADEQVFARSKEILETLGANIFHTGELGTGQVAKLCNNMIGATLMAINSEVLTMGVKAGVDARVLREIILKSTGANFQLETWMPKNVMINEYEAGFALKLMYKDVGLARDMGKELGTSLFIGNLIHELYGQFMNSDLKEKDFSVVSTFYQDIANINISDGKPRSGERKE